MVIANITYVLMYILHLHVGTCMRLRLHDYRISAPFGVGGGGGGGGGNLNLEVFCPERN